MIIDRFIFDERRRRRKSGCVRTSRTIANFFGIMIIIIAIAICLSKLGLNFYLSIICIVIIVIIIIIIVQNFGRFETKI